MYAARFKALFRKVAGKVFPQIKQSLDLEKQRQELRRIQMALPTQLRHVGILRGISFEVFYQSFSPEGTLLAAATEGEVSLWNVAQQQRIDSLSLAELTPQVAFSPDGITIALVDKEILLWSYENGQTSRLTSPKRNASGVAFSPDGKFLATGDSLGQVQIWDTTTGLLRELVMPSGQLTTHHKPQTMVSRELATSYGNQAFCQLAFTLDGGRLFLCRGTYGRGDIQVWNVDSTTTHAEWLCSLYQSDSAGAPDLLVGSPDGQMIAFVYQHEQRDTILLYHAHSLERQEQITLPIAWHREIGAIAFSPDSRMLGIADSYGTLWLWDIARHHFAASIEAHPDDSGPFYPIRSLAWSKSGILATGGWESRGATTFEEKFVVKLWQVIETG